AVHPQQARPVRKSKQYPLRPALPTKARPRATAGCAYACVAPGKPTAPFSFKRGPWLAASPATSGGWYRCWAGPEPQPLQRGRLSASADRAPVPPQEFAGVDPVVTATEPVRNRSKDSN